MWAIVASIVLTEIVLGGSLDIQNEPTENSPGLYYQYEAQARLYNSEWKIVTYLELQQASDNVDVIGKHIEATIDFCNKRSNSLWLNLTECRTTIRDATRKLQKLKDMRNLALQLIRTEKNAPRTKRGLFDFVGQISHSLFGSLDSENEEFFNSKFSQFEEEHAGLIKLAKEEMVVVKSTLKSVNRTLHEVTNNELKHASRTHQLSVLSSIGAITFALLISILCCCCCCCCCRKCWPKFMKWAWDEHTCSAVIFKPKLVNSVHTYNSSLQRRCVPLSMVTSIESNCSEQGDMAEMTPMNTPAHTRMTTSQSRSLAVGKR
jgi:hypothetical protein